MADDDAPTDVSVPETLGGTLGAVPPPPRSSDESAIFTDASRDIAFPAGATQESQMARFVSWLRWAAAPLGFFLFLAGLTAFGLLKDEPITDTGDQQAANVMPATGVVPTTTAPPPAAAAPTTTPEPPTTATPDPPTAAALPPSEPPPTEPPPTEPPPTAPPATLPPSARTAPPAAPAAPRYGPVCGYRPGQAVRITINGRPAGSATADTNGCVTVR
jgi:hypothetical protein